MLSISQSRSASNFPQIATVSGALAAGTGVAGVAVTVILGLALLGAALIYAGRAF